MSKYLRIAILTFFVLGVTSLLASERSFLLNGLDSKVQISKPGKIDFVEPGEDILNILDISDPANPKLAANLLLSNSLFGPPTNLQINPEESLALVTSAMKWEQKNDDWKPAPDNRLFIIDLEKNKPALIDTVEVGMQPSGIAISSSGRFALIANRADRSVSVVSINGKTARLSQTVPVNDEVAAVAITPDERRALIVKNSSNKIGVLSINDSHVTYDASYDMPVGQFPYNIDISPDGSYAVVAHTGNNGYSDGHADSLVVIRLDNGSRPFVENYFTAGDAPEGFAISPRGDIAIALLLGGDSILPTSHWAHNKTGQIVVFKTNNGNLQQIQKISITGLPEGIAFSGNGDYVYVSSFREKVLRVYQVDGEFLIDTETRIELPGTPASMRGRAR